MSWTLESVREEATRIWNQAINERRDGDNEQIRKIRVERLRQLLEDASIDLPQAEVSGVLREVRATFEKL